MNFEMLQAQLERQGDDPLLKEIRSDLIKAHGAMKENLRETIQELMLMTSAAIDVDNVYAAIKYSELVLSSLKSLSDLEGTHV